jgi:regulator of sirC expression with transglutaminase-like and TPR domain
MTEPTAARERLLALARATEPAGVIGEAALWIAAEEYAGLDVPAWRARLDALGLQAAERITPELDVDAAVAALTRFLFDEEGFRGNAREYGDPRNSFLNDVLERRLGIPITLSIVTIEVAARAGVTARGIGFPGHFLVRLERHGRTRLLDPFGGGRVLGKADCAALLRRVAGPAVPLDRGHLRPVTTREMLIRMLNNLKGVYAARADWPRALAAVERLVLLAPSGLGEVRDRGRLRARLGEASGAIEDWERYLREAPDAPDAERVRAQLRALREALAARN